MPSLPNISSFSGGSAQVNATVTATAVETSTVTSTETSTVTANVTATETSTVTANVTSTETSTVNQTVNAKNIDVVNVDADLVSTTTLVIGGNTINIPSMLTDISTLQTKTQNITATSGATTNTGTLAVTSTLTIGGNSVFSTSGTSNSIVTSANVALTGWIDRASIRVAALSTNGVSTPYITLTNTGATAVTYLGCTSGTANLAHAGVGIYLWDGAVAAASNYNGNVDLMLMFATGGFWYVVYTGQITDGTRTVNISGRASWAFASGGLTQATFIPGGATAFDSGIWLCNLQKT